MTISLIERVNKNSYSLLDESLLRAAEEETVDAALRTLYTTENSRCAVAPYVGREKAYVCVVNAALPDGQDDEYWQVLIADLSASEYSWDNMTKIHRATFLGGAERSLAFIKNSVADIFGELAHSSRHYTWDYRSAALPKIAAQNCATTVALKELLTAEQFDAEVMLASMNNSTVETFVTYALITADNWPYRHEVNTLLYNALHKHNVFLQNEVPFIVKCYGPDVLANRFRRDEWPALTQEWADNYISEFLKRR